jgi:CyaY protein
MDERAYRTRVDDTLRRIDAAFENVDPDVAESDYSQGTLVVTFKQTQRLILAPQAPARQLWAAFRNRAWHFNWDQATGQWLDDRWEGVELLALVAGLALQEAGVALSL